MSNATDMSEVTIPAPGDAGALSTVAAANTQMSLASLHESHAPAACFKTTDLVGTIHEYFLSHTDCFAVLAKDDHDAFHLVAREWLEAQFATLNGRDVFYRRTIGAVLQQAEVETLQLPDSATISEAIELALWRRELEHYHPMVVIRADGSRWLLNVKDLLLKQCRILASTLTELEIQRQATDFAEAERIQLQHRLLDASREAGRAEIATGILHDVGNVLNSVNVSASMLQKTLEQSKVPNLLRSTRMIDENLANLPVFLTQDERGQRLPGYLIKLAQALSDEQTAMMAEVASLQRSIEHIRQVVQMQQTYAKSSTLRELVAPAEVMEDALQMNIVSFERHNIHVIREFESIEPVMIDRHKVLQILINLVSNARNATKLNPAGSREIRVKVCTSSPGRLRFEVRDNGVGISPENLTRIFTHGFTTRKDGHGFGLHGSANSAREMNGTLTGTSEGPGRGAHFTLEIPLAAAVDRAVAREGLSGVERAAA